MDNNNNHRRHRQAQHQKQSFPVCSLICIDVVIIISTFLLSYRLNEKTAGGTRIRNIIFFFGRRNISIASICTFTGLNTILIAIIGSSISGWIILKDSKNNNEQDNNDDGSLSSSFSRINGIHSVDNNNDLTTPLLQNDEIVESNGEDIQGENQSSSSSSSHETDNDLDLDKAKTQAQIDHSLSKWRESIFVSSYIILTGISFILGIEAVDLGSSGSNDNNNTDSNTTTSTNDVVSIAFSLLSLQIIYFLSKYIISIIQTSSDCCILDLRAVHVHPLRFDINRYDAFCDICSESITGGQSFRCTVCDFDYCVPCYNKGRKVQDWSVLRGDSGVKISPGAANRASMGTYLLRSLGLLYPYLPLVIATSLCLLVNVICQLLVPNIEGSLFDDLIEGSIPSFVGKIRFLAIYWVGKTIFLALQRYTARLISRKLRVDLRNKLFDQLLKQDIAFFDSTRAGAMSRRIDGDVEDMSRPIPILVNNVLQSAVLIVGALTCCLVSSFRLTVLASACLGPILYLTYVSAEWSSNLEGQMVACEEEGSATITEAMTNIRTIRALSAEQVESKKFGRILSRLLRKMHMEALGDMIVEIVEGMLEFGVETLVLGFGGLAILHGHDDAVSIGQLIAFTMYWDIFSNGLESIQNVFSELAQTAGAAQRVFDLMDISGDIPLNEGLGLDRCSFEGTIWFDNVRFAYQTRIERSILDGINLEIPARKTLALVGRSGAGKSTLVELLLRFYDPRSGRILVDGNPLTELNLKSFHDLVGFVPQDPKLSFGTVRDNLVYGLPWEPDSREIEEAARAANCAEFIEELEDGYNTSLGENAVKLSGGQRQRLAIARAFLRRPRILLLDEATSHLDAENEQLVQEGIDRLIESASSRSDPNASIGNSSERGGCTVIVIAHRLSTVQNADTIAVLHNGQIAEQGNHDTLIEIGGIYSKLVAIQTKHTQYDVIPDNGQETRHAKSKNNLDMDNLFDTVLGKVEPTCGESGDDSSCSSGSCSSGSRVF